MLNKDQKFGKRGESVAVKHLKQSGYKIIERNYRTKLGEIDIIAKDRETWVFIEVKSRKTSAFGRAKYAVTAAKQRKICMVALAYLKAVKRSRARARFDLVAVDATGETLQVEIIKNAFEPALK
jgi:putative endonuclease